MSEPATPSAWHLTPCMAASGGHCTLMAGLVVGALSRPPGLWHQSWGVGQAHRGGTCWCPHSRCIDPRSHWGGLPQPPPPGIHREPNPEWATGDPSASKLWPSGPSPDSLLGKLEQRMVGPQGRRGPSAGRKARTELGLALRRCTLLGGCRVSPWPGLSGLFSGDMAVPVVEQSQGQAGGPWGLSNPQLHSPLGPWSTSARLPACLPLWGHTAGTCLEPSQQSLQAWGTFSLVLLIPPLRPSAPPPQHPSPGARCPGAHPQGLVRMPGLSLSGHQGDPAQHPHLHSHPCGTSRPCPTATPTWGPQIPPSPQTGPSLPWSCLVPKGAPGSPTS